MSRHRHKKRDCGGIERLAVLKLPEAEQTISNEHNDNYGGSLYIGYPISSNDRACQNWFRSSCGKALHHSL
jgi:hypothetical protein